VPPVENFVRLTQFAQRVGIGVKEEEEGGGAAERRGEG